MSKEIVDFILRGSLVRRFHTKDTIKEDLVGRHSHGVAMLCFLLTDGDAGRDLLMAALVHDLGEQKIGDIPSPTKRALGKAMDAIYEMENAALASAKLRFTLTSSEEDILNIADCLDGMLHCIRERRLGNEDIGDIFHRYSEYVTVIVEWNPMLVRGRAWDIIQEVRSLWRWK